MTKPMKYRDLANRLRAAGFASREGRGDHEVWTHPDLTRHVVLTQTKEASPGLTRKALKLIEEVNRKEKP